MLRITLLALLCAAVTATRADVFSPAYLQLVEVEKDRFDLVWRLPTRGAHVLSASFVLPPGVDLVGPTRIARAPAYSLEHWRVTAPNGLGGRTVRFEGLAGGVTDVIARVTFLDGTEQVAQLSPAESSFVVRPPAGPLAVAKSYLVLGIEHILLGLDHLLFVLALLLIVRGWRPLVVTITAFTVAHSITLATAALGWLRVPTAPVEAIIALSIVIVAAEALRAARGQPGITASSPWLVAFSFGLLHGLGFASALSEIGLPAHAVTLALLAFNLGVEAGQLLFVAAVLGGAALVTRLRWRTGPWLTARVVPYAIGSLGAWWTIDRVVTGVLGIL